MSCQTLIDKEKNAFCYYCSTTGNVFGPIMEVSEPHDVEVIAEEFTEELKSDPRLIEDEDIRGRWFAYCDREGV